MSKQDQVVKLLLVEDSADEAEQLISMLRNGGIALRPARAVNPDELEKYLAEQTPDMILVNPRSVKLSLPEVVKAASQGGKDIALIAVVDEVSEDEIIQVFEDGARAVALRQRAEHVQTIVRREFESLNMRRGVRRLESTLREIERRYDSLLDSSRDPIAYVHEGMHVRANRAYLEIFGFVDFDDIEGMSILDMIAPEDSEDFKGLLKKLSKGEKPPQRINIKAQRGDGTTFDATLEFAEATYEGEPCQQIVLRQQAVSAQLARELDELRSKDLVTDLFNRPYCVSELDRIVGNAAKGRNDNALILIEPDNFRHLLDTVGMGNTDLLLGDMANLMRRQLRESDIAGRFGEQTFGVIVEQYDAEQVRQLAESLRKSFEERIFEVGKQSVTTNISIGAVLIGEKNANTQTALTQASNALRAAQNEGGNRVNLIDPAAQDKADEAKNRHWLKLLKDALGNDGFVLFYQPIISLHGAEGEFYEILLRMQGPKGEISPAFFMPIAERHNMMPAIDRWVIGNAIKALVEREKAGHKTTFFVKISSPSLDDQTLLPWIAQQLKNARLRGDALVFEAPESKVVTNLKPARNFVNGLKQIHCGFALEQFGSGLNSFQLLKHIDAGYLKLDRNFMAELPKNRENQDKIKELCDQAHHAGKLTVAEFVEDAASMSILFTCGVNFVQGNFLQEPEKVMAFETA